MMTEEELHAAYPDLFQQWWDRGYACGVGKLGREARKEASKEKDEARKSTVRAEGCTHADSKWLEGQVRHWKSNFDQLKKLYLALRRSRRPVPQNKKLGIRQRYDQYHGNGFTKSKKLTVGFCIYCGADSQTMDHMIPKSRGGSDAPHNRVEACFGCDNEKGNMTYDEYMIWRKYHKP